MTKVKIKITGALMTFALVASVLAGGVGYSANGTNWVTCSGTIDASNTRIVKLLGASCTSGYKVAPTQRYYTAAYINASIYNRCGTAVSSGSSSVGLPNEEAVRHSYNHKISPSNNITCPA
ncbi:MAG: hypothetical protein LBL41_01855 [Bifidobacteriaceae bacterium]|jgi:hypothetical protein|nr:hypothetical protein [Bifidobacteriaceae bacterium]